MTTSKLDPNLVISSLGQFSKADLRRIHQAATYLIGQDTSDATEQERSWYQDLSYLLKINGLRQNLTLPKLRQTKGYANWLEAIDQTDHFILRAFGKLDRDIQRAAARRYLIDLLIRDALQMGHNISLNYILTNAHRMEEVFTQNFPGYFMAGCARMILDRILKGNQEEGI